VNEAIADLRHILSTPEKSNRYFNVASLEDIKANDFNLNVPRYVDTWDERMLPPISEAIRAFQQAVTISNDIDRSLTNLINKIPQG